MYLTSNATFQFDEIVKSFEVALRSFIADTLMNKYTDETSFQTELDNLRLSLQPTTLIYTNRFSAKLNKLTKDAKSNYQCRLPE